MIEGPPLERLMRRLAETPDDFLAEPRIGDAGQIATAALVHDLIISYGHQAATAELRTFISSVAADRNRLILVAIMVWLLTDEWFAVTPPAQAPIIELLGDRIAELAATGRADAYIADVERREELARTALSALGMVPAGESEAQAADRLSSVSAAERRRLLNASREAEERARAIREALIRKAAEESADKYTRE